MVNTTFLLSLELSFCSVSLSLPFLCVTCRAIALSLKVHKIENFSGSDFEFCVISLLVMLKHKGFVKNIFLLGHYWGRYHYSA
jgi:hypothetical protein